MKLVKCITTLSAAALLTACPGKIDQLTLNRILPSALERGDISETCALGESLAAAIDGLGTQKKSPDKSMTVIGIASAICSEQRTQAADLHEAAMRSPNTGAEKSLPLITDARINKKRAHAEAAIRFHQVWQRFNTLYPNHAETCPNLREDEEPVFLIGMLAGLLAVLHDGKGGREANIPLDVVLQAGRAARCLDNQKWWNVPAAMQASGWACVPGSGPKDIDPWQKLQTMSEEANLQGMRLASALYVTVAANAGRKEDVQAGVRAAASSMNEVQAPETHLLLDRLASLLLRHESDLIWLQEAGHRTETLGTFPEDQETTEETSNPFSGANPFGSE